MMAPRRSTGSRFGLSLAGIALGVQLALASWGLALVASTGDPADPFAEHALCLAGDRGNAPPAAPAKPTPHVHDGLCCLWHVLPGLEPSAASAPQPIAYIEIASAALADAAFVSRVGHKPANARAPPALA